VELPVERLSPADAAVIETFVVPRYLSFFGELVLEMLLPVEGARIAHLGCRTGYPDRQLYEKISGARISGVDPSGPALDLARNKAAVLGESGIEYVEVQGLPTSLPAESFSHVVTLHPVGSREQVTALHQDMFRVLYAGGQALVAQPLRGSFQEVSDLLREYALKYDEGEFGKLVEESILERPNIEALADQLESAGFDDVDIDVRTTALTFDSGRAFLEDPVSRLLIVPELKSWLAGTDLEKPLGYVRDAIDKYWSEGKFELTLNVGCASARRLD
jgi:ubiquinone/menaquinone biosynthesis C-methylase UbiE